jgi:hypothetical protein
MLGWKHLSVFVFLAVLAAVGAQAAPTSPCVRYPKGKVPATHVLPLCVETGTPEVDAMQRIVSIRKTLPVPADWHFFTLSEAEWSKAAPGTHTAYSNLAYKTTFIRETYAESASDAALRQTIAHEMGHRICNCTDEPEANRVAAQITQGSH